MKRSLRFFVGAIALLGYGQVQASTLYSEDFETLRIGGGTSWTGTWTGDYASIYQPGSFLANGAWTVGGLPNASGIDLVKGQYLHADLYGIDLVGTPGPGSISTSLAFVSGQKYKVSFLAAASNIAYNDMDVSVGGQTISFTNSIAVSGTLNSYSAIFTSDGGSLLTFSSLAGGNGNLFLDNIVVESVPEPFTLVLGAAGIGLALRRRAKTKSA